MRIGELRRWGLAGLLALVFLTAGCRFSQDRALSYRADQVIYHGFDKPPRLRFGSYPSSNIGTIFIGPNLGNHGYSFSMSEKDGIAYTCRGGTIDVIHVRIAADWTAYLTAVTYRHLMNHDTSFSYKLAVDRSTSFLTFTYPDDWDSRPKIEQMAIAKDIALAVGPYLTFTMTTWHEIITWYGFKCMGPFPEFPSSFSWEDSYSNLLGTIIGVRALQDPQHEYNEAVKLALDQEMRRLGIISGHAARQATETVRGKWWTGNFLFAVDMKKRNFDIGLRDGYVTPTLLPNVPGCPHAQPEPLPVPRLDVLAKYGFAMNLEIEPHEWEKGKFLHVVYGDKIQPRVRPEQFALLMDDIRRQATAMYGPEYSPDRDLGRTTTAAASAR